MPIMNVWLERDRALTGRMRVRRGDEHVGIFARAAVLIVQVEERYVSYPHLGPDDKAESRTRWRDLRTTDLPSPRLLVSE